MNIPEEAIEAAVIATEDYVSTATRRNWRRLGVEDESERLITRANKRRSTKRFAPVEYFSHRENIAKFESLAHDLGSDAIELEPLFFELGVQYLKDHGVLDPDGRSEFSELDNFIQAGAKQYSRGTHQSGVSLPLAEDDPMGCLYQTIITEARKNELGIYYTPRPVVETMVSDIRLAQGQKVFDPCCGTLAYLLRVPNVQPENIYACDIDPVAILIAKFNFYRRFPSSSARNIRVADYIHDSVIFGSQRFDYIITNPPWGAQTNTPVHFSSIRSGETFSLVIERSLTQLAPGGELRILLPESVLNVRTHRDVRSLILSHANLLSIRQFDRLFTGVTTKYMSMTIARDGLAPTVQVSLGGQSWEVRKSVYSDQKDLIFRLSDSLDEQVIEKVLRKKVSDLSRSMWALGIVTGNNKDKLLDSPSPGSEAIFTGKEITPYALKPAKKFIFFDRANLQQAARDEFYRADIKLVYKFISKRLTFAIDDTGSLFLNSANILIPHVPNLSIFSVAAFLNSPLYQYLYMKLFREVKILKGNLLQLPFPDLSSDDDLMLTDLVKQVRSGVPAAETKINDLIYQIYELDQEEISRVEKELYGTATR